MNARPKADRVTALARDDAEAERLTKVASLTRDSARRIAAVLPLTSAQAFLAEHAYLTGYVPGQEHAAPSTRESR